MQSKVHNSSSHTTEMAPSLIHCCLLAFCTAACISLGRAYVSINLSSTLNSSLSYRGYKSWLDDRYSSYKLRSVSEGYLYEFDLEVGCAGSWYVPDVTNRSDSWFAVFRGYPRCSVDAMYALEVAGYELVLIGDRANSSGQNFENYGPYVIISGEYIDYLILNALSDFSDPDVLATVDTNIYLEGAIMALVVLVFLVVFFFVMLCGMKCMNRLGLHISGTAGDAGSVSLRGSRRNPNSSSAHLPLRPEQTKKLLNKKYERLGSLESCGICFEELKDGDEVRDLPCGHNNFHTSCLDQWLLTCNRSCPLCRHNVTKQRPAPQARASGERESSNALLSSGEELNYGTMS